MTVRPSGSKSEAIFALQLVLWLLLLSKVTLLFNCYFDFGFGYQCIGCGSICISNSLDIKLFLLLLQHVCRAGNLDCFIIIIIIDNTIEFRKGIYETNVNTV
jgi:hypothetical protein